MRHTDILVRLFNGNVQSIRIEGLLKSHIAYTERGYTVGADIPHLKGQGHRDGGNGGAPTDRYKC